MHLPKIERKLSEDFISCHFREKTTMLKWPSVYNLIYVPLKISLTYLTQFLMEGISQNYKYISHDSKKDNLTNLNKILKQTPNQKKKKTTETETAIDACRKNDDAVLRMTAGRSRWQ